MAFWAFWVLLFSSLLNSVPAETSCRLGPSLLHTRSGRGSTKTGTTTVRRRRRRRTPDHQCECQYWLRPSGEDICNNFSLPNVTITGLGYIPPNSSTLIPNCVLKNKYECNFRICSGGGNCYERIYVPEGRRRRHTCVEASSCHCYPWAGLVSDEGTWMGSFEGLPLPTPRPTPAPTAEPTPVPTNQPTPVPTPSPTPQPPMVVALKGGRNNLYCADEDERIICNRPEIGSWEKFTIEDVGGGSVALKGGQNGLYCRDRADKDKVKCGAENIGYREKFTMEDLGGGKVAFKGGLQNRYCSDEGDTVVCNRDEIGSWEQFALENLR